MDAREQRGLEIAAVSKITENNGVWSVPSQTTGGKKYAVFMDGPEPRCTCPDHETRHCKCKHIYAVEFTVRREATTEIQTNERGETTVTQTVKVTETAKVTYAQNWPAYNAAQTNEKRLFLSLLHDLCDGVEEPIQTFGRPRLPLSEQVFCATYKVYSTVSTRRFMSDLEDAREKGFISKAPHFNSVLNTFDSEGLTPVLQELIKRSSLPLKAIETDFCVDSSGFGTSRFEKWFDVKHGGMVSKRDWVKVHAMAGVLTNIVTSVEITGRDAGDGPQFPALVKKTATTFAIREVSADKAYSSRRNLQTVQQAGGTAFIPFKSNATGKGTATGKGEGCELWNQMFHYYSLNKMEFLQHYHKRSNSESTFSMIKAKFGDAVRSKNTTAQVNEALCKVLAHNLCVVIQSMFELGVEPTFCAA